MADPARPDDIVLVAGSGLALEVAEAATARGHRVLGCLDEDHSLRGSYVRGWLPVLGDLDSAPRYTNTHVVLCAGRGTDRQHLAADLAAAGLTDDAYGTVIAPGVVIPPSCRIGAGSVVLGGSVLTAQARVGSHVVVMPQVVITHDVHVEDFATLCAGVTLGGGVRIGEAAYIGMNASIREGVTVGAGATLGMGSVLLGDLPAGETWAGVPARPLRSAIDDRGVG